MFGGILKKRTSIEIKKSSFVLIDVNEPSFLVGDAKDTIYEEVRSVVFLHFLYALVKPLLELGGVLRSH